MTDLKDLIARQRVEIEQPKNESVDVVLGGELVRVQVSRLLPDVWQQLVAEHPPRKVERVEVDGKRVSMVHSDSNVGYDQQGLPRDYPADHITVDGAEVDQETWRELFSVLNSVHQNNVHTVMWGLNVFDAIKELDSLGKAKAGSPSS